MVQYRFVTQWFFPMPIEQVWRWISDEENWGLWLQDFRQIKVRHSPANGEKFLDIKYRGDLPYSFHFTLMPTRVEAPCRLELDADGDLKGTGCWALVEKENGTAVTYIWEVGVSNPVFDLITRLPWAKALTERNHNATMARAEVVLRHLLIKEQSGLEEADIET